MAYQMSPDVVSREWDLTTYITGPATTEAGIVVSANWGPLEEIKLVASEGDLVEQFGKPDNNTYVDFFTAANFLAYGRNLKVVRGNANSNTAVANGTPITIKNETDYVDNYYDGSGSVGSWAAKYPGALGNSLKISVCPSSGAFSANASLTANTTNTSNSVVFSDVIANDTSHILVVGDYVKFVSGATDTGYIKVTNVTGNTVTLESVAGYTLTGATAVTKWEYADEFDAAPGTSDHVSTRSGANDELHIIVVDEDGKFTGVPNTILEKFAFVSKASDATLSTGISNYYKNVIKDQSKYLWWMDHMTGGTNWGSAAAGVTFTAVINNETVSLTGGSDVAPTDGQLMLAYDRFKSEDDLDVSFIMTAAHSATVISYVINNLTEYRKDCVALVSPPKAAVVNNDSSEYADILTFRDSLPSSSYAFMTDNWKYQFDKYNNTYRWIPDNGDVAGIMALSDFNTDPWYSPAGLNRGHVKNVTKLAWVSNKSERDELYKKGVNSLVTFKGEGTVLWGDKTMLAKPSAFDRINVRRLFIVLRKGISKAARYTIFELNDRFTRAQFISQVEPFLRDIQGRRGIYQSKVVCDETNNTGAVIDRNEFIGDIYVKPTRSINFITLNFVAVGTSVSFDEVVGQIN